MSRGPGGWLRASGGAVVVAVASVALSAGLRAQTATPPYTANDGGRSRPPVGARADRKAVVQQLLDEHDVVSDAPLAVAAFPLTASSAGITHVVVAVEIGRRQILPESVAIGIRAVESHGSVAFNGADVASLAPAAPDVPTPLLYTVDLTLPQGRYTLRVAAVDGAGRQAALDHPLVLEPGGARDPLQVGALMIGAAPLGGALRPLARSDVVRSGAVAWVEATGATPSAAHVEVIARAGEVLAEAAATIDAVAADGSRLARATLPVQLLPPGSYEARLSIEARGVRTTRTRPFSLGRLPPPDADALGAQVTAAVGPFSVSQVLNAAVLAPVLERALSTDPAGGDETLRGALATVRAKGIAAVSAKPFATRQDLTAQMLRGAILLGEGKLEDAAGAFRSALRTSSEFLPAIVYLGACYAAGGRDREAVGAWQTALVTESQSPLVFTLAADGLVRLGDSAQALMLIAEAAERWPDDTSLVRRHALAVAAREGPAPAADALIGALEQASTLDTDLLALAARFAVLSAARDDDGAAARVAKVEALSGKAGAVPALLARWAEYFRARNADGAARKDGGL